MWMMWSEFHDRGVVFNDHTSHPLRVQVVWFRTPNSTEKPRKTTSKKKLRKLQKQTQTPIDRKVDRRHIVPLLLHFAVARPFVRTRGQGAASLQSKRGRKSCDQRRPANRTTWMTTRRSAIPSLSVAIPHAQVQSNTRSAYKAVSLSKETVHGNGGRVHVLPQLPPASRRRRPSRTSTSTHRSATKHVAPKYEETTLVAQGT